MIVPKFENETQEADWWFDNRELLSQEFQKAAAEGRLGRGTVKRRMEEAQKRKEAESPIQLDTEDASKAQALAARKGISYQTYIKTLVHEALERETAA
jgi:predicted DNA binding CopG/RHH family protein